MSSKQLTEQRPPAGTFGALHSRDFRLVFFGQCLSIIGDGAYVTVLGWFVYNLTQSAGMVALVLGTVTTAKLLALLFGGALADRYDRRRLMILSDLIRGVAMAILAVCTVFDLTHTVLLIGIAGLVGLFDSLFTPSFSGLVPSVVDKAMLGSANGLIGFVRASGAVAGPTIGGVLYAAFGPASVFGIDAATFFWAALLVGLSRRGREPSGIVVHANPLRDIAEGARYVRSMPILVASIPVAAVAMMLADAPTQTLMPRLVAEHFGGGSVLLGSFQTALGIGFAAGALLAVRLSQGGHRAVLVMGAWAGSHFVCACLALQPFGLGGVALSAVRGTLNGFGGALWETLLMHLVPRDKLSRVFSVDSFGSSGLLPMGYVLAGLAAPLASASSLVAIGQGVAGILMLSLLFVRQIREVQ
jgi:MFS family permease